MKQKYSKFSGWFKKLGIIGKIAIVLGVLIFIRFLVRFFKKVTGVGASLGDIISSPIVAAQYGISAARVVSLDQVAKDLQRAFWDWTDLGLFWDFRTDEDEQLAIDSMNKILSVNELQYVKVQYEKLYPSKVPIGASKKSLKQCVYDYLDSSERNQINSSILNGL